MSNFLNNDIFLMTAACKEHKHKIFISPKSHILAFKNSYPSTDNEGDRVNKHSWSKYMPFWPKFVCFQIENFKIPSKRRQKSD